MTPEGCTLIQEIQCTAELKHLVYQTIDKKMFYLNVSYKGKYHIQKMFLNNFRERQTLEDTKVKFNTEQKVVKYLNLEE